MDEYTQQVLGIIDRVRAEVAEGKIAALSLVTHRVDHNGISVAACFRPEMHFAYSLSGQLQRVQSDLTQLIRELEKMQVDAGAPKPNRHLVLINTDVEPKIPN